MDQVCCQGCWGTTTVFTCCVFGILVRTKMEDDRCWCSKVDVQAQVDRRAFGPSVSAADVSPSSTPLGFELGFQVVI